MTVSNMVSSPGVPDWWTIYTDQDAETYDPHDPRALFHEAIMALESHWDPFIGHARDWEDQLVVDVDLAGICGTLDPGHDFHDLLRDGPEQCLLLLAAAIHQVRPSVGRSQGIRTAYCYPAGQGRSRAWHRVLPRALPVRPSISAPPSTRNVCMNLEDQCRTCLYNTSTRN